MSNPYERETIINATDGDDVVRLYSEQRFMLPRLLADERFTLVREGRHKDGTRWGEFTIPASEWNPIRGAKRRTNASPEQRARSREQMLRLRASSEAGEQSTDVLHVDAG